jgi:uncharacterized protein YcfJ
MRKTITSAAIAALVALPLIAGPTGASASCRGRANTGTVVGGVGGALVGNSISHGGAGAVIGGLGGAVLGHQIAKSGCGSSSRHAYYRRGRSHYATNRGYHSSSQVYYDQNGNPVYRR